MYLKWCIKDSIKSFSCPSKQWTWETEKLISCPSKHWNWETEISACLKFYSMGWNPNPFIICWNMSKSFSKKYKKRYCKKNKCLIYYFHKFIIPKVLIFYQKYFIIYTENVDLLLKIFYNYFWKRSGQKNKRNI